MINYSQVFQEIGASVGSPYSVGGISDLCGPTLSIGITWMHPCWAVGCRSSPRHPQLLRGVPDPDGSHPSRRLFPFQYFVFDFHVPPDVMFDKIIKLSVSDPGGLVLVLFGGLWK